MKPDFTSIFFEKGRTKVFLNIQDGCSWTDISKKADVTYAYVGMMIRVFKGLGLITIEKKGRTNIISLTGLGKELQNDLRKVWERK